MRIDWEPMRVTYRFVGGAVMVASLIAGIIEGKDFKLAVTGMIVGALILLVASLHPK